MFSCTAFFPPIRQSATTKTSKAILHTDTDGWAEIHEQTGPEKSSSFSY